MTGTRAADTGRGTRVLGVDSGGSGLRIALVHTAQDGDVVQRVETVSRTPVRTGPGGIDPGHLLEQLMPAVAELRERIDPACHSPADRTAPAASGVPVAAVCVGAAGMATLGEALRRELPGALADRLGTRRLALAADAVTGYAGALGERAGAVVAAGTGMIGLGTDLRGWRRVDGWGHLLGDCGSGAWVGRAGLEAALRAHDGRHGGSRSLLARAEARFGPAPGLPQQLYPRTDRPAVLASFAPDVAEAATDGDQVAAEVLRRAADEIAETAATARADVPGGPVALTGGLFRVGEPLLGPLRARLAELLPDARLEPAAGDPLDGAVLIARALAAGSLRLPADAALLRVTD